jgi:hypothetical protein
VELENQVLELTKECDLKEHQLQKLKDEVTTFKDFLQVSTAYAKFCVQKQGCKMAYFQTII